MSKASALFKALKLPAVAATIEGAIVVADLGFAFSVGHRIPSEPLRQIAEVSVISLGTGVVQAYHEEVNHHYKNAVKDVRNILKTPINQIGNIKPGY